MDEIMVTAENSESTEIPKDEKKSAKNPHSGHRERMRDRFLTSGLDGFAPHEVMEFILFYTHSRCNTNDIAHNLIETFGSLPGVLEASYDELIKVNKINKVSATFITFLPELFRRYSKDKDEIRDTYGTIGKLSRYCRSLFVGATVEQVYMLLFDNSMHLLDCTLLAHGTVNSVPVMTRRIAEKALEKHASYVVISHNHPNGLPLPSQTDMEMTDTVENALALFQIPLLEHILVAGSECAPLIYQKQGVNRSSVLQNQQDECFLRSFYGLSSDEEIRSPPINPSAFL